MISKRCNNRIIFSALISPALISLLVIAPSCVENFRQLDEKQVRRQFHLPQEVRLDTLVSRPETSSGWFGREGLRIRAVFQFTGRQFDQYVEQLGDGNVWRPISFLHYVPPGADSSTASSHDWRPLPLPELPPQLAYLRGVFDSTIRDGWWYCNLVLYIRGDSIPHAGGGYHFQWHTRGVHATEVPSHQSPIITTFAILDPRTRRLYAWIGFSG